MAERFEQFRLSLMVRPQRDAFTHPDPTREQYIRDQFSREWRFEHYKTEFIYIPRDLSNPSALISQMGKQGLIRENRPPEEGFADDSHMGWLASVLLIDPTNHVDGQKVAIQNDRRLGKPGALIDALVHAVNEGNPHAAFYIQVEPIIDAQPFWEFVAANDGKITSITFELVAPNGLFSTVNDTGDDMRRYKEIMGARKVTSTFQNGDGLDIHSEPIKEAVGYASGSGGKIRAKAASGRRYNSTEKPKDTIVHGTEEDTEPLFVRAARLVVEIFGR